MNAECFIRNIEMAVSLSWFTDCSYGSDGAELIIEHRCAVLTQQNNKSIR